MSEIISDCELNFIRNGNRATKEKLNSINEIF